MPPCATACTVTASPSAARSGTSSARSRSCVWAAAESATTCTLTRRPRTQRTHHSPRDALQPRSPAPPDAVARLLGRPPSGASHPGELLHRPEPAFNVHQVSEHVPRQALQPLHIIRHSRQDGRRHGVQRSRHSPRGLRGGAPEGELRGHVSRAGAVRRARARVGGATMSALDAAYRALTRVRPPLRAHAGNLRGRHLLRPRGCAHPPPRLALRRAT